MPLQMGLLSGLLVLSFGSMGLPDGLMGLPSGLLDLVGLPSSSMGLPSSSIALSIDLVQFATLSRSSNNAWWYTGAKAGKNFRKLKAKWEYWNTIVLIECKRVEDIENARKKCKD
ncbi:hypothetical protein R1flu_001164 [Riccia fluitans]|uniref:Secreted protein n=1 Tax=Riccia fluitans TaxID=41844 RepID=A0ABD1Y6I6_9MARC